MRGPRILALGACLVLVAGCGDPADDVSVAEPTPAATVAPVITEAPEPTGQADVEDDGRFVAEDDGFSIRFPDGWEILENEFGTRVAAVDPASAADADFAANLNVVTEDLGGHEVDAAEYAKLVLPMLETSITDFALEHQELLTVGEAEAARHQFTGRQGVHDLRFSQTMFVDGGTAYVVTYTAKQDDFEGLRGLAEAAVETFRTH